MFEFGVFLPDDEQIAAHGLWAQVYVDRVTRRPVPIPDAVRAHLEAASPRARPGARPEHTPGRAARASCATGEGVPQGAIRRPAADGPARHPTKRSQGS